MRVALVALAGAVGALCRYGIGLAVGVRPFPLSTLAINVVGSFGLGLLLTVATSRGWSLDVSTPLAVGFLGAFTTFSTFTWESLTLARTHRLATAGAYVALSICLGFAAADAGLRVGEALRR